MSERDRDRVAPDFSRELVTAVVQDAGSGEVLMVAHMDQEAWARTLETGRAWFHSRSRGLWEKGATSGSYMDVVEVRLDCDRDAVLLRVRPQGPACHTGARSCFEVSGAIDLLGRGASLPREVGGVPGEAGGGGASLAGGFEQLHQRASVRL